MIEWIGTADISDFLKLFKKFSLELYIPFIIIRYNLKVLRRRILMHRKIILGILLVLGMLVLTACGTSEEEIKTQMAPILTYTSDKEENIKFVRTKSYDGMTIKEFTDSKYYYEVTPEGRLMTIFLRNTPSNTSPDLATKEEIQLKAEDNLKRLDYDVEKFKTVVAYHENMKQYESVSREKQDEYFTGNNIYMQYASDGTLISISFKYENPNVLSTVDKISVDEAKDIIINYFRANASTEEFASKLSKEIIKHEVDVYNNKKVYNLYFTLDVGEGETFDFVYAVSTESGIILYRKEL